jgi:hypothetical protein
LSRGRRFETAGFGAFLGVVAYRLSPGLALGLMLALIFGGCALQFRAERKQRSGIKVFAPDGAPLAGRERDDHLQALVGAIAIERAERADSERGHWADKSIDAPLTADGFTILDTLGDEDEALAELVGEAA